MRMRKVEPQADNPVSLVSHTTHSLITTMDSFFPIATAVPAEETQVPINYDGGGTPGGSNTCTIACMILVFGSVALPSSIRFRSLKLVIFQTCYTRYMVMYL